MCVILYTWAIPEIAEVFRVSRGEARSLRATYVAEMEGLFTWPRETSLAHSHAHLRLVHTVMHIWWNRIRMRIDRVHTTF